MTDYRESLYWDKQLEGGLPDCRLKFGEREKIQRVLGRMQMDVVFCAGPCGKECGLVPVHCPHVYFLCDDCFAKMNGLPPPGMVEGPQPAGFEPSQRK